MTAIHSRQDQELFGSAPASPGRRRLLSMRTAILGFTVVELIIGIFLALVVALAAGAVYLGVTKSFTVGSRKLRSQQEASLLSTLVSRRIRVGSGYQIYNVPDRTTPADSGDGLAILDSGGGLLSRLEWSPSLLTIVDGAGNRATALTLQSLQFKRDPLVANTIRYRFAADDPMGGRVEIRSSAHLRN